MQNNYSNSSVPAFNRSIDFDYDVVADDGNSAIYQELLQISEEIEKCRLRNC